MIAFTFCNLIEISLYYISRIFMHHSTLKKVQHAYFFPVHNTVMQWCELSIVDIKQIALPVFWAALGKVIRLI